MGCCQGKVSASEPKENLPLEKDDSQSEIAEENGTLKEEPQDKFYNYDAYSRTSPPPKTPRTPNRKKRKRQRPNPGQGGHYRSYDSNAQRVYNADPACFPVILKHPNLQSLTPRVDGYRPQENWIITSRSDRTIPEEGRLSQNTARSLQKRRNLVLESNRSKQDYNPTTLSKASSQSQPDTASQLDQESSFVQGSLQRSVTHIDLNLRPEVDSPVKRQERAMAKLIATSYCYRTQHRPGYLVQRQRTIVQERLKSQGFIKPRKKGKQGRGNSSAGVRNESLVTREDGETVTESVSVDSSVK